MNRMDRILNWTGTGPASLFVYEESGGVAAKGCFQIHVEALTAKLTQQLEALLGVQAAFVIGTLYITFVFAGQVHFHGGHHQVIAVFVVKKIGGAQEYVAPAYALMFHHNGNYPALGLACDRSVGGISDATRRCSIARCPKR